jgi:hypothetical protein
MPVVHTIQPGDVRAELRLSRPFRPATRCSASGTALSDAARRTFLADAEPVELEFNVRVVVVAPVSVTFATRRSVRRGRGLSSAGTHESIIAEEVAEHVGRLDGTPYAIGAWVLGCPRLRASGSQCCIESAETRSNPTRRHSCPRGQADR